MTHGVEIEGLDFGYPGQPLLFVQGLSRCEKESCRR